MMRKSLLLVTFLLAGLSLQAQTAREFKPAVDSLRARLHRRTTVDVALKLNRVTRRGTALDFIFSKELGDYPWRTNDKEWFEEQLRALMPSPYRAYKIGHIIAEKDTLDNLQMPPLTNTGKPASTRFRRSDPRSKAIPLVRTDEQWNKGLSGRHIALWQSHGRYYESKTERWEWQRAATHRTVEDMYTQSYVLPFLMPMLENAGAVVMTPRERDVQSWEIICDNDPSFTGRRTGKMRLAGRYKETGNWSETSPGFADTKSVWREYENPFMEGTARMCETSTEEDPERKAFATWYPNFPERGEYAVYVSYRSFANSTTDAVYTVHHRGGESVFHVNQRMGGGTWVYLGTFPFEKGLDGGYVRMSNQSTSSGVISADAVKFGGGMGKVERGGELSGLPAYLEGALYSMQWYGIDTHLFDDWEDDYTKDYAGRGKWATEMAGGSRVNPNASGRKIPFDLTLAFHSDAGVSPNDTIIGTLGIYSGVCDGKDVLPNGESRLNGRLLTDFVQTQVVDDIRKQFNANWTRRSTWDRSYSESRTTSVPAMLLELLSHQNFADMKYGLDPSFRFTVSRSVYKGILKYLSARFGCSYAVQPLPVKAFAAEIQDGKAVLSWEVTKDPYEPTATPSGFILYTREDGGAFDNGVYLEDVHEEGNRYSVSVPIHKGKLYSYRIVAFNDGGKSFPSETLAAGYSDVDAKKILIVNNFTRISAPAWFDTPSYGGFMDNIDSGVPYIRDILFAGEVNQFDRTKKWTDDDNPGFGGSFTNRAGRLVAGNTFDYPAVHGRVLLNNGYTVCSVGTDYFQAMDPADYAAVDVICGKQVTTRVGRGAVPDRYTVFPVAMQDVLRKYAAAGGSILVAGSYIGTDAWDQVYPGTFPIKNADQTKSFIQEVLGYKWITNFGDASGIIVPKTGAPIQLSDPMKYNRLFDENVYRVENPDGIEPAGAKAQTFLRYAGTEIPAATVFDDGTHRVIACGFPLEALTTEGALETVLLTSMKFLVP